MSDDTPTLSASIRGLGTHASVPQEYASDLADQVDTLEQDRDVWRDTASRVDAEFGRVKRDRERYAAQVGRVRALHRHGADHLCTVCAEQYPCETYLAVGGSDAEFDGGTDTSIDDTIRDIIQRANPGTFITGWVMSAVAALHDQDGTAFVHDAAPGQSITTTRGLIEIARDYHRDRMGDLT